MLVNGHIRFPTSVQPRGIGNIAAVQGLVKGIRKEYMGQLISCVVQHGTHISLSLIIEETMRGRIHISQMSGAEGFHHITGLIVQLTEIIGMGLDFHPDVFLFYYGKQLLHGFEPHAIADFLPVRIPGQLCIDDFHTHIPGNLNHTFPVVHCKLTLLLCGA